jgi:diguanylate cyclase (GGDEF)-like protein
MLVGSYNPWLVMASLLIAMLASYTALDMAGRVAETQGRAARWWLFGGSVAMGFGIWSMHFLGMLAFSLPVPMGYDPFITLLSLLIAIASSAFALWMVCQQRLSWQRLSMGALLMGAGVCAMHYTGMAAMRMKPGIQYDPFLFFLSVVIAITASGAALWIAFHLRRRSSKTKRLRAGAAVVMGFAIAGMHYTGMAAARFPRNSVCSMAGAGHSTTWMAPLIVVFALAVLSIALLISMLDFRMEARTAVLNSSLDRANKKLQFLAMHDNLTKLPNRTLLEDRLDQEIANAGRNQKPFSVLFLDLDGFKHINDAYGHQTGDLLLIEVAQRIRSVVRARDTVARLGGDEFVLLADTGEPGDVANLASTLIMTIQRPFVLSGHDCQVSVSIGIAIYKGGEAQHQELLKNADAAMYHAKALGRNTYCFFEVSMNEDAHQHLQVLHDLRLALNRQELILYYQPKFDAHTHTIIGAEALIRWKHPTRGLLLPADFIPLAEKIGLIVPIGEWTIREACRQMSEWRAAGYTGLTVAVNLSAVQFNHSDLLDLVQNTLDCYALDPGCLILEITESTAMRDPSASMSILQKLRQMGVKISIDDFGTGYSSLLYLKRLPAGELKIDRGFVRELAPGTEDAAIISAIVALGRTLNLEIVAEGVETVAQQEFLTNLGCNSLQGFLLGRPMPPDQLIAAIDEGNADWDLQEIDSNHAPRLVAQIHASIDA